MLNGAIGPLELLIFQVTTFCNLDCSYCYLPDRSINSQASLETLQATLRLVEESEVAPRPFTISWHAGEPLAGSRGFFAGAADVIAEFSRRTGVAVTQALQTNGTLIDEDWCRYFLEHDVRVGVSVDGPEWLHDKNRKSRGGRGSHRQTMRGINLLENFGVEYTTISVLTRQSLDHPDDILKFLGGLQTKQIGFNFEEIDGINTASSLSEGSAIEATRAFAKRIYELTSDGGQHPVVREIDGLKDFLRRGKLMDGKSVTPQEQVPFRILVVGSDGRITTFSPELLGTASAEYSDFILGNVATDSIASIIQSELFQRMWQDIQAGVVLCKKTCAHFTICGGGNPVNKYCENGSFRTTESLHCRVRYKTFSDEVIDAILAGGAPSGLS